MTNEILTAIIGFAGTLAGIFATSKLTLYRIEQLEKKMDKHNNLIERVYKLERQDAVRVEQISVVNHRIADLEREAEKQGGKAS